MAQCSSRRTERPKGKRDWALFAVLLVRVQGPDRHEHRPAAGTTSAGECHPKLPPASPLLSLSLIMILTWQHFRRDAFGQVLMQLTGVRLWLGDDLAQVERWFRDIHKKSISCCVRQADGTIIQESTIAATRHALDEWMRQLPQPWMAGMQATLFTGWIYDYLESAAGSMPTKAQLALGTLPVWYILSTTWQPNWKPRLAET